MGERLPPRRLRLKPKRCGQAGLGGQADFAKNLLPCRMFLIARTSGELIAHPSSVRGLVGIQTMGLNAYAVYPTVYALRSVGKR